VTVLASTLRVLSHAHASVSALCQIILPHVVHYNSRVLPVEVGAALLTHDVPGALYDLQCQLVSELSDSHQPPSSSVRCLALRVAVG
jgi:hypothetical protein